MTPQSCLTLVACSGRAVRPRFCEDFRASTNMPRCAKSRMFPTCDPYRSLALQTLAEASMCSPTKAVRLLGLSIGIFLACLPLSAQTYSGRILGTVTDQTGAALTGAQVVVTDVQRGVTRTLTTDQAGEYVAPDLSPGLYKVHAEAKGFKSVERLNIELEVAKDARIDLTLQPGQVSETVVVSGEIPLVDTTSSTLGGTLSNAAINDLPLNGRNYENLLQLRPGVVRYPGGGFSTTSTNGLRAEDNAYFVEGLFNSEPYSGQ